MNPVSLSGSHPGGVSAEDEEIENLAEGPYQAAARETFDEFRVTFTDGMKLLFDRTKDSDFVPAMRSLCNKRSVEVV